jgi:hypothetical protein
LGRCYANGEGVAQDYEVAVQWYHKAAEQGEAKAQNDLGVRYESGTGVAQNCVEAVKWYRKAAEQGEAKAQCNLGECYLLGHGVQQDYAEAVKWYRKAAESGDKIWAAEAASAQRWAASAQRRAAAAQRQARDANWYKDVSQGGTSRTIQGPHQVPMPDPTPGDGVAGEIPSEEAGKRRILSEIVSDYHRNHTYVDGGVFVCGDMACDVWNMVKTKGIEAKIGVGNVDREISSLRDANHAWVLAETSPGNWLALETTAGRVVYRDENPRYYSGWSFDNPKKFKEFNYGHR